MLAPKSLLSKTDAKRRKPPSRWIVALSLGASAALLLLPLGLPDTLLWEAAQSLAHALVFAALATMLLRFAHIGELQTWLLLAAFGAATELLQLITGRQASIVDFANNLLGLSGAVLAQVSARKRAALPAVLAAVCAVLAILPFTWSVVAYTQRARQFPVLFQYATRLDMYFLQRAISGARSLLPAPCQGTSPRALRIPLSTERYAGVLLREPMADWRAMSALEIRLGNPSTVDLVLTIRVHDELHDWTHGDRYNGDFLVPAGERRIVNVKVDDILHGPRNGRLLDLARIQGIAIFRAPVGPPSAICLESITLASRAQVPTRAVVEKRQASPSRYVAYASS